MLRQRLLFGSLMIAALGGFVYFDGRLSSAALERSTTISPAWAIWCALPITLLIIALVVLSTYEMGRLCRSAGLNPAVHWAAFVGAGLTLLPWVEMQQRIAAITVAVPVSGSTAPLVLLWLGGGMLGTALAILSRRTTERAVVNMGSTLLIIMYLGLLASFAVRVRCLWPGAAGAAIIVYFLLTVKAGDIGAYFVGMSFGRRKLAPWLSPGKTVEGALGAIAVAGLVGLLGMLAWPETVLNIPRPLTLLQALVFGGVMAIAGHLGDLVESAMKRDTGVKDSGALVPAFGGLLDIVDSPVFTAPIAWWLLTVWARVE